jgi:AraC-like DNA-binding protein
MGNPSDEQDNASCPASSVSMTDVLDLCDDCLRCAFLRCLAVEILEFAAPWHFRGKPDLAAFYYVLQGDCRLDAPGVAEEVDLGAGDLAVVVRGYEHCLRNGSGSPAVPLAEAIKATRERPQGGAKPGEDRYTSLIYVGIAFDQRRAAQLLLSLPPVIAVQTSAEGGVSGLENTLRSMLRESSESAWGSRAVVDHLAQAVLIQAVRGRIGAPSRRCSNQFAPNADTAIGLALGAMHAGLASPWTLAMLAKRARMSRSVFSSRFKALLSVTPMQYLLECRMERSCELLRDGRYSIKKIAAQVGYASKAAYSNAFKRWHGQSPSSYRRSRSAVTRP